MFELESSTLLIAKGWDSNAKKPAANLEQGGYCRLFRNQSSSIFVDVIVESIRPPWPVSLYCLPFLLNCYVKQLPDFALPFEPAGTGLNGKLRSDLFS